MSMTHNNNIEYMHPEIIDLCVNCKAISCSQGKCTAVVEKIKELKARGAGRRKTPGVRAKLYEYNGEKHTIQEWSKITGISKGILYERVKTEPPERWFVPYLRKKGASHA